MSHTLIRHDRFLVRSHQAANEEQGERASSWLARFVEALLRALSAWAG